VIRNLRPIDELAEDFFAEDFFAEDFFAEDLGNAWRFSLLAPGSI
jgi:hypothetical protein